MRGALLETWYGLSGSAISTLTTHPDYPDRPDEVAGLSSLEAPSNRADNFGARLHALLVPPADGSYTFYIASDDNSELRLSTDEDPGNRRLIVPWFQPCQGDISALEADREVKRARNPLRRRVRGR